MALYKVRCNFSGESSQFSFLAAVPTFRPLALEDHHAIADALNWYPYRLATCVYWINCVGTLIVLKYRGFTRSACAML